MPFRWMTSSNFSDEVGNKHPQALSVLRGPGFPDCPESRYRRDCGSDGLNAPLWIIA